jgi:hypothetical protein
MLLEQAPGMITAAVDACRRGDEYARTPRNPVSNRTEAPHVRVVQL